MPRWLMAADLSRCRIQVRAWLTTPMCLRSHLSCNSRTLMPSISTCEHQYIVATPCLRRDASIGKLSSMYSASRARTCTSCVYKLRAAASGDRVQKAAHLAMLWVVEALDEGDDGALAGSGLPHQSHRRAHRNMQAQVPEHLYATHGSRLLLT